MNPIRMLTIRQTAKTGILSEYQLRLMQRQGRLPGIYVGNRFLVNYELLAEDLQEASRRTQKEEQANQSPAERSA